MNFIPQSTFCNKGHWIQNNDPFCAECGSIIISKCLSCGQPIQPIYRSENITRSKGSRAYHEIPTAPPYCSKCGKPFPWTQQKIDILSEYVSESPVNPAEKQSLIEGIPDILSDSPQTRIKANVWKSFIKKIGKEGWAILQPILIEIASTTAKKIIFPD
jgi:hypothetical protein